MNKKNRHKLFSNLEVYNIAKKLTDVVHHEVELALGGYNVSFKQWQVLNVVRLNIAVTPTSIANQICADKPSITRVTDHLVSCSFLKRERGVDDRRTIQLKLTEVGELVTKAGYDALEKVPAQFKSKLTSSEANKVSMFEGCYNEKNCE